jgi:hypothetical protein
MRGSGEGVGLSRAKLGLALAAGVLVLLFSLAIPSERLRVVLQLSTCMSLLVIAIWATFNAPSRWRRG